jgi:hypothetical protein
VINLVVFMIYAANFAGWAWKRKKMRARVSSRTTAAARRRS